MSSQGKQISPEKDLLARVQEVLRDRESNNLDIILNITAAKPQVSRTEEDSTKTEIVLDSVVLAKIEELKTQVTSITANPTLGASQNATLLRAFLTNFQEINHLIANSLTHAFASKRAAGTPKAASASPSRTPATGAGRGNGARGGRGAVGAGRGTPPATPSAPPAPAPTTAALAEGGSTQAPPLSPASPDGSPVRPAAPASAHVTVGAGTVDATAAVGGTAATVDVVTTTTATRQQPAALTTPPRSPSPPPPASVHSDDDSGAEEDADARSGSDASGVPPRADSRTSSVSRRGSSSSDDGRSEAGDAPAAVRTASPSRTTAPGLPLAPPSSFATQPDVAQALAAAIRAGALAAAGQDHVGRGEDLLRQAAHEDEHLKDAEHKVLSADADAAAAESQRAQAAATAQQAALTARTLEDAASRQRQVQAGATTQAANAGRQLRDARTRRHDAEDNAATRAQKAADKAAKGRGEFATGVAQLQTAAGVLRGTAEELREGADTADANAAKLARQADAVSAATGVTPAADASTASGSPGVDVVPPAALPTDGPTPPVVEPGTPKKDEKGAKTTPCTTHPVKRTLDKKVVGTLIAVVSTAATVGALLFAPQYVVYVGSVALAKLGIHATILTAKITGSLVLTAISAAALTGVIATINAAVNYFKPEPKVKAAVKVEADGKLTATATDAAGHTIQATTKTDAAPTSSKGFVGTLRGLWTSRTAAATKAAPAAPAVHAEATVDSGKATAGASL